MTRDNPPEKTFMPVRPCLLSGLKLSGLTLIGLMTLTLPVVAQPPAKDKLEITIDKGLAFLHSMQEKDGSWPAHVQQRPAVCALAVMAFLSAGHVPGEGPYGDTVEKGVRWILKLQGTDGLFMSESAYTMYHQGICTLMLAEVVGMTDAELAKELKPRLEKAVKAILKGQRTSESQFKGGWRYRIDSQDADVSVSGWQVMALRAARNIGCDVPAERIESAIAFFLRCRDAPSRSKGFGYMPGSLATVGCTGTCILALELAGKKYHQSLEVLEAGSYLLNNPPRWGETHFFYNVYYSAQAMFQLNKNYWRTHRPRLHAMLMDNQNANGSWIGSDNLGPIYGTSMSVLALSVEYRFLPIYQRSEEDPDKSDKQ